MRVKPGLHEDFKIDQRVSFDLNGLKGTGTIVGVSFANIIFSYIILLDTPLQVPDYDKPWKAITLCGGDLRKI